MKGKKQTGTTDPRHTLVGEVRYMVERAQARQGGLVRLGPLVFFSTQTGDAWVLDPSEGYALCIARNGEKQTVHVVETDRSFEIGWSHTYAIRDGAFIVTGADGRVLRTFGYPVREIAGA